MVAVGAYHEQGEHWSALAWAIAGISLVFPIGLFLTQRQYARFTNPTYYTLLGVSILNSIIMHHWAFLETVSGRR